VGLKRFLWLAVVLWLAGAAAPVVWADVPPVQPRGYGLIRSLPRGGGGNSQAGSPLSTTDARAATTRCDDGTQISLALIPPQIGFHMTSPTVPAPITIRGQIVGDHDEYVFALRLPARDDELTLPRLTGPPRDEPPPAIATSWELRYRRRNHQWTAWEAPQTGPHPELAQSSLWWVVEGKQGVCDLELRCALQPEPLPAPGHYERHVQATAVALDPGHGRGVDVETTRSRPVAAGTGSLLH
jgi:hypothetical protein